VPENVVAEDSVSGGGGSGRGSTIRLEDLERWEELQDLIEDGEVLPHEVQDMFRDIVAAESSGDCGQGRLGEDGFVALCAAIDDLFESDPDAVPTPANDDAGTTAGATSMGDDAKTALDSAPTADAMETAPAPDTAPKSESIRSEFLSRLSDLSSIPSVLPCGLECPDSVRKILADMITALELESESNIVQSTAGNLDVRKHLVGDWDLLYTSSATMAINKGLSGLGRSASELAKFQSLTMKLRGDKYFSDATFIELIGAGDESLDVTVTGEFQINKKGARPHPITGQLCASMCVDPEVLEYGLSKNGAEQWASLGPIKLVDVTYLDNEGLQISRGSSFVGDSVFVWKRVNGKI